ncbi:MAG: hypothetical protein Q7S12_03885 [bacterium]|nr:hypothetical protein [bacterium]
MKRLIFVLALSLFGLSASHVYATPVGDAIREVDRASVQITTQCDYIMKLKNANSAPIKKSLKFFGNGSFIEHPELPEKLHFVITAVHVVVCPQELNKRLFDDKFTIEQVASFEINTGLFVKHGASVYPATVSQQGFNKDSDLDLAILDVLMPSGAHGHNSVLTDEGAYDIKDEVIVRGFMPGGLLRLKVTHIEDILGDKLLLQLNTPGYSGLSGSPVLWYKDGRYYVIGVLVLKYQTDSEGVIDVSFATRLKKEYFEPTKKP